MKRMKRMAVLAAVLLVCMTACGIREGAATAEETLQQRKSLDEVLSEIYLLEETEADAAESVQPEPEPIYEPEPVIPTETISEISRDLPPSEDTSGYSYVLNTHTMKIHYPDCSSVGQIKEENKAFASDYAAAIAEGYEPCGRCKP